ncbi:MAG TPA: IS1 family transposase [Mucilaginibacter sp.]|nr:IS1 family transposase [Mucilaginibacter sp.]
MQLKVPKCIKGVDRDFVICTNCNRQCVKNGYSKFGKQRFRCGICGKSYLSLYTRNAYKPGINSFIQEHLKEGCGIRSIARLLKISANTVLKRIIYIAKTIERPIIFIGKEYEVDEMVTYVGSKKKLYWIVYALEKDTRRVVDFAIGRRTNKTLRNITDRLLLSSASKVYTDKLLNYKYLIPSSIHSTKYRGTNYIERNHLTIRTHLKRLNRRSICYSKSAILLSACLRIFFWT